MNRYKDSSGQNLLEAHDINNPNAFLPDSLNSKLYHSEMIDCSDNSNSQNEFDSDSRSHSPNIDHSLNPVDD
jgi:hypothetical protein